MADAGQYRKIRDIILSNPDRKVVVVSAAGKRFKNDHKITDLLYLCFAHAQYGVDCSGIFEMIRSRYLEIREELGLYISKDRFRKLAVYGEPGRIAAYRDGSIWRMVIVVFALELPEETELRISKESRELRWFTREEIKDIHIVVTHSDIVEEWFLKV